MIKRSDDELQQISIKQDFQDYRKITGRADCEIEKIGEKYGILANVYKTLTNELISYGFLDDDFNRETADKYLAYGEELYEISKRPVYIYVTASPHVKISVQKIESDTADITIKINMMQYSGTYQVLDHIKELVKNKTKLDEDDLFALSMIPMMGPVEDRRNLRIECLELWKIINEKNLIK